MKQISLLVGIFLFTHLSVAEAADKKGGSAFSKSTPALVAKGKQVYATNCLTCHGEKGDGNGPAGQYLNPKPRSFVEAKYKNGGKPEQVFQTVTKGLPGTAMTAYGHLSEEDRWAVVHYIETFKKK